MPANQAAVYMLVNAAGIVEKIGIEPEPRYKWTVLHYLQHYAIVVKRKVLQVTAQELIRIV
jgi:Zn-dependent peptidase ImmA (M78 family)